MEVPCSISVVVHRHSDDTAMWPGNDRRRRTPKLVRRSNHHPAKLRVIEWPQPIPSTSKTPGFLLGDPGDSNQGDRMRPTIRVAVGPFIGEALLAVSIVSYVAGAVVLSPKR